VGRKEKGRRRGEGREREGRRGGIHSRPFLGPSTNKRPENLANQAKILAPNVDLRMTGDLNYQLPGPSPPIPRKLVSIVTRNSLAKLRSRVPYFYDQNLFLSLLKLPSSWRHLFSSPPVSQVRKKVVVTTTESSRSHRVARSHYVYKYPARYPGR
jgi:hypothetical protein